jgi:hypothetical protein
MQTIIELIHFFDHILYSGVDTIVSYIKTILVTGIAILAAISPFLKGIDIMKTVKSTVDLLNLFEKGPKAVKSIIGWINRKGKPQLAETPVASLTQEPQTVKIVTQQLNRNSIVREIHRDIDKKNGDHIREVEYQYTYARKRKRKNKH